jgi:hypothetical protein
MSRLVELCRELDAEMDGVKVPASAAAILNTIRAALPDPLADVRAALVEEIRSVEPDAAAPEDGICIPTCSWLATKVSNWFVNRGYAS